ncbi:uncharacterized protein ARMOST_12039 [Armillaria ostoyae]|uniref:Uncharacterized protein n=1 Tax=Armillaria ostoyae TaxID=47428 RepID=A0A284RIT4_ARMOS|nr:uncharacterized protein ARMOST_12039 [Armillaria ostoyae]
MIPFFAIFLIPAWFTLVDGRLSNDESPIIGIEFGYPYSRAAIQGQDSSSLEVLAEDNKSIDYYLLICTKERCGIQFYDDGYDEMLAIADDLWGEGIIEELLTGAGILAKDILHVIIIDEPTPVLRQHVEVSFPGKILPPDPYEIVLGAALKAKWLSEPEVTCAMSIIPFGLGVQLSDGIFGPVIMRNAILPKQASRRFSFMERQIRFFTGSGVPWEIEYTNNSASQLLGTMDLPVVEGAATPFDVIISVAIDEDGLMNFTAAEGGMQTSMVIPFPHNPLKEEDVVAVVNEAEDFARSEQITDLEEG